MTVDDVLAAAARLLARPARMDASDGPVCGCGLPSARECGLCERCSVMAALVRAVRDGRHAEAMRDRIAMLLEGERERAGEWMRRAIDPCVRFAARAETVDG